MEEEKEGNILRRKIFGPRWRRKTERVKGEIIWRKKIFGLRRRRKYWEKKNIWLEKKEKDGEGKGGERKKSDDGGTKFPILDSTSSVE